MTNLNYLLGYKQKADRAYHTLDDPIMTDAEYDQLCKDIIAAGGKIETVGAPSDDRFKKVKHHLPMGSLDNAFSEADVTAWFKSLGYDGPITAQPKYDGLSLSLTYIDGVLDRAVTRGDGEIGEDVTAQALFVEGIPVELKRTLAHHGGVFEVRGEVVMPKATFAALNSNLISAGKKPFANPRNAAAGSIRQKDPKVTATRGLRFYAFGVAPDCLTHLHYESGCLEYLFQAGFNYLDKGDTSDGFPYQVSELLREHEWFEANRSEIPFDIDGVVYKVDDRPKRAELGSTSRTPRWAIAHKFSAEKAQTKLLDIDWQVGRTGIVAPVARLEPVNVGGVMVSNATLHNIDEIARLGIMVGDRVELQRAGDVIPQITGVVKGSRHDTSTPPEPPTLCPSCLSTLVREDVYLRCPAGLLCDDQMLGGMEHFASRDAMNIDGLGPAQLEELFFGAWFNNAAELMALPDRDTSALAEVKGWGKTSVKKLMTAITKARTVELDRFIYALGIPLVGKTTSKDIAKWCGSVEKFFDCIHNQNGFITLINVDGIGDATIDAIEAYFDEEFYLEQAYALRTICDILEPKKTDSTTAIFEGMTLVFTGALERWPRETAIFVAEDLGAKVTNTISKKTTLLITGSNVGAVKFNKATELGVNMISEDDFIAMVNQAVVLGYKLDVMD